MFGRTPSRILTPVLAPFSGRTASDWWIRQRATGMRAPAARRRPIALTSALPSYTMWNPDRDIISEHLTQAGRRVAEIAGGRLGELRWRWNSQEGNDEAV